MSQDAASGLLGIDTVEPPFLSVDRHERGGAGAAQGVMVIMATLLPVLAIISLAPALPAMLAHFAGVRGSAFLVPAALTMPGLCIALFSAPMGLAVDRFGRRPVLLAAMPAYGVIGLVPLLVDDLHMLLISRFALGVAEAAIMTAASTLLADYFDGASRVRWIAIQSAVVSMAATVLFLAGGMLTTIGWRAPFLLYGLALPLALLAARHLWEPERRRTDHATHGSPPAGINLRWFVGVLAVTFIGAVVFYVAPIHASVLLGLNGVADPAVAGLLGSIGTLGVPLGAWVFRHASRGSIVSLLAAAFLAAGLGLAGMGWSTHAVPIVAAMVVNQIGCGVLLGSLINWVMQGLPPERRGWGIGIWTSVFFLGQFVCPIAIAVLGQGGGGVARALLWVGGVAVIIGASALLRSITEHRGTGDRHVSVRD